MVFKCGLLKHQLIFWLSTICSWFLKYKAIPFRLFWNLKDHNPLNSWERMRISHKWYCLWSNRSKEFYSGFVKRKKKEVEDNIDFSIPLLKKILTHCDSVPNSIWSILSHHVEKISFFLPKLEKLVRGFAGCYPMLQKPNRNGQFHFCFCKKKLVMMHHKGAKKNKYIK